MTEQTYTILGGAYTVNILSFEYKTTFWRKKYIKKFFYVYRGSNVFHVPPILEDATEEEYKSFIRGLVEGYKDSEQGKLAAYQEVFGV